MVLAAFRLGDDLPVGRTRVATLSFAVEAAGEPRLAATPIVASSTDGAPIDFDVEVQR